MKLTGFDAIAYAEREGLLLNKAADRIDDSRHDLSVAEAEAIATEDPDLIWVEVPDAESPDRLAGELLGVGAPLGLEVTLQPIEPQIL